MSVTVRIPSLLARHADGQRTLAAEGGTVAEVLRSVETQYPALGQRIREATDAATSFVTIYLNEEDVRFLGGSEAKVGTGDEVSIVSAIAGG